MNVSWLEARKEQTSLGTVEEEQAQAAVISTVLKPCTLPLMTAYEARTVIMQLSLKKTGTRTLGAHGE
jgi:hypothetical protein